MTSYLRWGFLLILLHNTEIRSITVDEYFSSNQFHTRNAETRPVEKDKVVRGQIPSSGTLALNVLEKFNEFLAGC